MRGETGRAIPESEAQPEGSLEQELKDPKVKKFWGRAKKIMLSAGMLAVLEACGLTREEIEKMPEVKVEDLAKNLDQLAGKEPIKTHGIPEFVGEKTIETTSLEESGGIYYFETTAKRTDFFKLHANDDPSSPSVDMMAAGKETSYVFFKQKPEGSGLQSTHEYTVLGRVRKIKDDKGKEKFMLEASQILDTTKEEYK